jgi:ribosomal-protein-alanine N-acetyltransferase
MNVIIETERLYLREIIPSDLQSMFEMDADPDVHKFLGRRPVTDIEQSAAYIASIREQYVENGVARIAIIEKESNEFVGWGGLKLIKVPTNGHQNYYDLGYRFAKRYWGNGYATESTAAVINYAFDQLKLPVIYAIADVEHAASRKVLEKSGFLYRNTFIYEGDPHAWYELKKPELL